MDQTPPSEASPQAIHPATSRSTGVRRSRRLLSSSHNSSKPVKAISSSSVTASSSRKAKRSIDLNCPSINSITPNQPEKKRRRGPGRPEKKVFCNKVIYNGGKFEVGDNVYLKRKEGPESDTEDPDVEECRVCFRPATNSKVMIECDDCLGGFHLKCVKPPLKKIPEGDWVCTFCTDMKNGKEVTWPKPPEGKKIKRTLKEKLLSSDLWAARIESLWREKDGSYWLRCRWYTIPEETTAGRQPHNSKRELYRTSDFGDIEMECVLRHCFVLNPKEFREANDAGDDVFYCEYEYDIHCDNFKRISDLDNHDRNDNDSTPEVEVGCGENKSPCESNKDSENEKAKDAALDSFSKKRKRECTSLAANKRKGIVIGLQKTEESKVAKIVHERSDLAKAKSALLLTSLPQSPPCRYREMEMIDAFVKCAIRGFLSFGRRLYIHGLPGTGKTMSVLNVMRSLESEVDSGEIRPYSFVEINTRKLSTPENIYEVLYEQLSGNRVGSEEALQNLDKYFSDENKLERELNEKTIVLLVDELEHLMTRNQSVLYNLLDWPTRPNAKLAVIGIGNTMEYLPDKVVPEIPSKLFVHRLCFSRYNDKQLQEIISSRLNGITAFEDQAIQFASKKVAEMSGDASRVLDICRRAAELAHSRLEQNNVQEKYLVNMIDIDEAFQQLHQASHIQIMRNCSRIGKMVLVAMVKEMQGSGLVEVTSKKLLWKVIDFCLSRGEEIPEYDDILRVCSKLAERKIILSEQPAERDSRKFQLNYSSDDVAFALRDHCSEIPWLSTYLLH